VDECTLSLPAARWLPADKRGIPAGEARDVTGTDADFRTGRPIGQVVLDHALTGLSRDGLGRAWARLASGSTQVALWAGQGYHWLQVFTGDTLDATRRRRAVAVEPMTCPPDALNSGTGLITIEPGETWRGSWGLRPIDEFPIAACAKKKRGLSPRFSLPALERPEPAPEPRAVVPNLGNEGASGRSLTFPSGPWFSPTLARWRHPS